LGCSEGGSAASVAVLDRWFQHAADVDSNVVGVQEYFPGVISPALSHGTQVAAVLAARGGNRAAVTGMAYRQQISLYNADAVNSMVTDSTGYPLANLGTAASSNRIVNVSLGRRQSGQPTLLDSVAARRISGDFEAAIANSDAFVVVAARNDGVDAKYSGYPLLIATDTFSATRVIVVGGRTAVPAERKFP
jgi:hypothetical protein